MLVYQGSNFTQLQNKLVSQLLKRFLRLLKLVMFVIQALLQLSI